MRLVAAVGSVLVAGAKAVLAKLAVCKTDSGLVTALHIVVVPAFSRSMVFAAGS